MTIHRVKPEPNFDRLNHQNAGASGRPRFLFKRFRREKGLERPESYEAPAMPRVGHAYLFDEFLNWLDGGPPSATRIEDNIKSFAMVIAAMETTVDGQPKTVDL